jgi:hypothetical protein
MRIGVSATITTPSASKKSAAISPGPKNPRSTRKYAFSNSSVDFRLELTRHFHSNLTRLIVA